MATNPSSAKKPRTLPPYELLYHPTIPGRGEFIRLALEASGTAYTDVSNEIPDGYSQVQRIAMDERATASEGSNAPVFAPPALRVPGAGRGGEALVIAQTPNVLQYLGPKIGMTPAGEEDEAERVWVQQVTLTALDLNNEIHDTHHPIASAQYYEEQKKEALAKAKDVRETRIPKYLSYFERTLKWNAELGKGKYLVGDQLSYADTTVWQVLDGMQFAFPKELSARKKEFPELFAFCDSLKEEKGLKEYLASKRRLPYSMGVFRHYPELDRP